MNKHHWLFLGAAAVTFFWYNSSSSNSVTIPGADNLYYLGQNLTTGGGFSFTAP